MTNDEWDGVASLPGTSSFDFHSSFEIGYWSFPRSPPEQTTRCHENEDQGRRLRYCGHQQATASERVNPVWRPVQEIRVVGVEPRVVEVNGRRSMQQAGYHVA